MSERASSPLRRRAFEILERGRGDDFVSRGFDIFIIILILINVFCSVIGTVAWVNARYGTLLAVVDYVCVAIFILEYAARLWTAPENPALRDASPVAARWRLAGTPLMIVDFIAILPSFIALVSGVNLNVIRVLRIARFYRLARYVPALATIGRVIAAEWRPLVGTVVLFVGLLLISGTLMYIAEGGIQPDKLGDVPSAMWWAVVTLSTVGYGDVTPITAPGKVIAAVTMVFGIMFFALPVGIIATGFQEQIHRRDFVVSFAMVARVPLFAKLDITTVARLVGILRARKYTAGTDIVTRGDLNDGMYFIASGEVEVILPSRRVLLKEGDFFGEIALTSPDARRTATVTATRACEILKLELRDVHALLERHGDLAEALAEVARSRGAQHSMPDV